MRYVRSIMMKYYGVIETMHARAYVAELKMYSKQYIITALEHEPRIWFVKLCPLEPNTRKLQNTTQLANILQEMQ